jgi:hypothetical protein
MDWQQVAQIAQKGNDIISHTHTHQNLSIANPETLQTELAKSQQILRSKGYAADVLIYPYGEGFDNETVRDLTAQHYLLARGTESGKCNLNSLDRYGLHSYGIYHNITSTAFASFLNGTQGSTINHLFYPKLARNRRLCPSPQRLSKRKCSTSRNNYTIKTLSQEFLKNNPQTNRQSHSKTNFYVFFGWLWVRNRYVDVPYTSVCLNMEGQMMNCRDCCRVFIKVILFSEKVFQKQTIMRALKMTELATLTKVSEMFFREVRKLEDRLEDYLKDEE